MAAKRTAGGKKRRRARRRYRMAVVLGEILFLTVVLAGFYLVSRWDKMNHVELESGDVHVNQDIDEAYASQISSGYKIYGLFGMDGDETNCDVVMLVSLNEGTGEIRMVSIYRDTIMEMPDGSWEKINQGINQGKKGTSEMNILNKNLDLKLDGYVMVDWTSVAVAINLLGGVDLEVTDAMMTEINGYINDTVKNLKGGLGSYQLAGPGYQHLDGVQTVAYCRLRHQDNDFNRARRQREVLEQLFVKAKQLDPVRLAGIIDAVFPGITTTMTLPEALELVSGVSGYQMGESTGFPFYKEFVSTWRIKDDYPVFAMDLENNVTQLHEFLYGTRDYEPSDTVKTISAELRAECEAMGLTVPETTPLAQPE